MNGDILSLLPKLGTMGSNEGRNEATLTSTQSKVKKNMAKRVMDTSQKFYLSKRGLIETVIDQLKNICQIEHSRHRKPANAFACIVSGLVAYWFKGRKPSIKQSKLPPTLLALTSN